MTSIVVIIILGTAEQRADGVECKKVFNSPKLRGRIILLY